MQRTYAWRRLDQPGLELMQLATGPDGIAAHSTIIDAGPTPFMLTCDWRLDGAWRAQRLTLEHTAEHGAKRLEIARTAQGWRIDGLDRPDLAQCLEVDVSATPFCNGLALRALNHRPGELTALYVDAANLSVTPSRQAYERVGAQRWRYVDLGVAAGFRAVLDFDADWVVTQYEGLFERV